MESAGGASYSGQGSVLDLEIREAAQKTALSLGSRSEVERSKKAFERVA